ncbi:MAG: tRNA (adenosine(37)-N6)-dimethylallyltransferase MiaA [Xanthomonadales bacterium]|nr:tRNA (adenosine(37)-N6)-dimethylallyltransferase MiaA [Xanthomonadales bacterium]
MHPADCRPRILFLMGPTASGKTALACKLAERFPIDLISVDSALVYRGMNVGAAKPDAATLGRFPHRLIDIRDPGLAYSAAEFRLDAIREIEAMLARGRVPLLVGGTGLYFRALERGLSPLPQADPILRAELARESARKGKQHMHERLAAIDPAAAARLNVNDLQRVQRALEVIELSGKSLSELHGVPRRRLPYHLLKLALLPKDRAPLHTRIAERFEAMLAAGLLTELKDLRARADWADELPSMRAVGYRQGWPYLDGACSFEEFRLNAIHATRQLAKRQITWLRSELDAWMVDPDSESVAEQVSAAVDGFLVR